MTEHFLQSAKAISDTSNFNLKIGWGYNIYNNWSFCDKQGGLDVYLIHLLN